MKRICASAFVVVVISLATVAARAQADAAPSARGRSVVDLLVKNHVEAAMQELERLGGVEALNGATKIKISDDWAKNHAGKYSAPKLVEIATASEQLQRETWILTGPAHVLRVQLVFYLGAEGDRSC